MLLSLQAPLCRSSEAKDCVAFSHTSHGTCRLQPSAGLEA